MAVGMTEFVDLRETWGRGSPTTRMLGFDISEFFPQVDTSRRWVTGGKEDRGVEAVLIVPGDDHLRDVRRSRPRTLEECQEVCVPLWYVHGVCFPTWQFDAVVLLFVTLHWNSSPEDVAVSSPRYPITLMITW